MNYKIINIIVSIILFSTVGYSCNCDSVLTVKRNIELSTVVFSGTVISSFITGRVDTLGIKYSGDTTKPIAGMAKLPKMIYKIKVDKIFKGNVASDTLTIITGFGWSTCGIQYKVGERYITYATAEDLPITKMLQKFKIKSYTDDSKTFWTDDCLRTRKWEKEEEELILEALKK